MVPRNIKTSLVVFALCVCPLTASGQTINVLTSQERAQGWQLLFDGKSLNGWHPSTPPPASARAAAPSPAPLRAGALAQIGSSPQPCATPAGRSAASPGAS